MADEHNFDITLVEEQTFDLTTGTESDLSDSHSFSLIISIRNLFNVIIEGLTTSTSWFVRMAQGINISVSPLLLLGLNSTIKLKRIVINVLASFTSNFISEVKLKRIMISASFKQTINNPVNIALKRVLITPIIKILRNIVLDISIPKIAIVANAILGNFIRLWSYDATALWTMDGETLGDLDYSES